MSSFFSPTGMANFFKCSTTASVAFSMPLLRPMGFAPAAIFFIPSVTMACARIDAVVVPSPATSFVFVATSLTISAPRFSILSGSSISFAIVTPSFVIVGAPNPFSKTTLRPFGPNVILTAFASLSTPRFKASLASVLKVTCFAMFL